MGRHGLGWDEGRHGMRQEGERLESQNPCLPSIGPSLLKVGGPGDTVHPLAHKLLNTLSSYPVTDKPSLLGTLLPFSVSQSEGIFPGSFIQSCFHLILCC